jgi:hypothetical protein
VVILLVLLELLLSDEVSVRYLHLYSVSHLKRQGHGAVFSLGNTYSGKE